jgi:antitoxin MazE
MTQVKVAQWGNSTAIRLPKDIVEALGVTAGSKVDLSVENGRAVIRPARPEKITLKWILEESDRLGLENMPETVDWGPDVGTEIITDDE